MSTSDNCENKHSKLFVGGISIHTTDEGFRNAFSHYGDINDSVILRDPVTNRSRGFGFITFNSAEVVQSVIDDRPITIDNREVDVKRAIPKDANNPQAHAKTDKVFIGGLPSDVTVEELKHFFIEYGAITDVELIHKDGVFKGYGFITFQDCDTADKVIIEGAYDIRGNHKICRVSKAGMRVKNPQQFTPRGGHGGYGGSDYNGYNPHKYGAPSGGYGGGGDSYGSGGGYSSYGGPTGGYGGPTGSYGGPSGGYGGPSSGGYGSGRGGYGHPPSGGYDYGHQQQTASYSHPTSYGGDYGYGYSGGSSYSGGSGSYSSYKGEGGRGGGGRGGRPRYKPY